MRFIHSMVAVSEGQGQGGERVFGVFERSCIVESTSCTEGNLNTKVTNTATAWAGATNTASL